MSTGTQILQKFNLIVDDASELSDSEALELANDVYQEIQDDRPWEWLKVTGTGTTSISVPYVPLPADFKEMFPNYSGLQNGSFNNLGVPAGYMPPVYTSFTNFPVVFVGSSNTPYKVIPFQERRNFRDTDGYCYIDIPNQRLVFTRQPVAVNTIEFEYVSIAAPILAGTSPLFRAGFHKIISYGMAVKFEPIEHTDRASSYAKENQALYMKLLEDMALEDAALKVAYS